MTSNASKTCYGKKLSDFRWTNKFDILSLGFLCQEMATCFRPLFYWFITLKHAVHERVQCGSQITVKNNIFQEPLKILTLINWFLTQTSKISFHFSNVARIESYAPHESHWVWDPCSSKSKVSNSERLAGRMRLKERSRGLHFKKWKKYLQIFS